MTKKKYTKEQLEFYFKKLMNQIKRIPREEDMQKAEGFPSVKAYTDRFGSWNKVIDLFANKEFAKKRCLNCKGYFIRQKVSQKFCSKKCQMVYYSKKSKKYTSSIDKKIKKILGDSCIICDFPYLLEIHCLDNKKESKSKLLKAYNKKDLHNYVLLCPNHHLMVHKKLAQLYRNNEEMMWKEI